MAYGFQNFDAAGNLIFDSNYPVLYMTAANVAPVVNPTGVTTELRFEGVMNPKDDAPVFLLQPPVGMGVRTISNGSYSSFTGEWLPYSTPAVNIETLSLNSGPVGVQVPYWCFINKVTDSGKRYGMQTFDENGVLTFDSETNMLEAKKWIGPAGWAYHGSAQSQVDPNYTLYYYYAPADGFDSFAILSPGGGDGFDVGEGYVGFRAAWGKTYLWFVAHARNGGVVTQLPTVILGVAI